MSELDKAIALCESAGLTIVRPRDTPDEQLRLLWDDVVKTLRIAEDIAASGAKLTVRHGAWLNPHADAVKLLRDGVVRKIDTLLGNAVVVREQADAAD